MPKTSHKKHRPFDFRLIDLVESEPVLYSRELGLNYFESMKAKNVIWQKIGEKMNTTSDFCIKRWSNLRGQFQKELRYCRDLCPRLGIIRGSSWPYLERMRFIEPFVRINRSTEEQSKRVNSFDYEFADGVCTTDEDEHSSQSDNALVESEISIESADNSMSPTEEPISTRKNDQALRSANIFKVLENLDSENRESAERRILIYLCQCQIRTLNNESIDDLAI